MRKRFNQLQDVYGAIDDEDWMGSAKWELTENKDGFTLFVGPDQSDMVSITVFVKPDGDLSITLGPTDHVTNPIVRGRRSPWYNGEVNEKLFDLIEPYVVDTVEETSKERARDVRSFAEASKEFEFGNKGKTLPDEVKSNIASMLTGLKSTAGPPQEQMKILKKQANKGGRNKSKRASKKRRTTRRR